MKKISVLIAVVGLLIFATGCSDDYTYGYDFTGQCEDADPAGESCDGSEDCPTFTCICGDGNPVGGTMSVCL